MFTNQPAFDASEICKQLNKCGIEAKGGNFILPGGKLYDFREFQGWLLLRNKQVTNESQARRVARTFLLMYDSDKN